MMTRRTHSPPPPYDPEIDRRSDDRKPDAIKGLWSRRIKPSEAVAAIMLAGLLATAVGWRFYSVAELADRVTKIETRQEMDSYVLCVLIRRTDPDASPPGCQPIIQSHGAR